MARLTLIAALASDGGIGRGNELLVRLPEDMAHFKALTLGHTVLMGRKTWDSIPARFRPLVQRRNLVLSRQSGLRLDGAEVFASLVEALAACAADEQVFIIGGAEVYAQALPRAEVLELTEIAAGFDGADAFFPTWERRDFREVARESQVAASGLHFDFVRYERLGRRLRPS